MAIQLRPYQQTAVDAFFQALADGRKRQLVVLPTGAGKTIVFGSVARRFHEEVSRDKPILVIAHRTELLDQAEQKIRYVWPEAFIGRIQGARNEQLGDVLLASTQTLVAGRRIPQPGLIIYDECHHSRAEGALGVLERLGVFESDGPPLLGVTATPSRSDRTELGDIFEHLTYERTILDMIMDGYLSDVRGVKVEVPGLNLGAIRTVGGDYNAKDLSYVMNIEEALDAVVDAVLTHAPDRKTLVFAVDVKHARALAERFQKRGIACAAVDGAMKAEERAAILQAFSEERLRVLVNCQILTEGYDQPDVDCVVIARPTRSQALYVQMVGRALRLHPAKSDALVLDLSGASDDKSLQTFARLMRTQRKKAVGVQVVEEQDIADDIPIEEGESVGEWLTRMAQKREKAAQVAQAINLFANRSRYRWQQIKETFAISYGDNGWAYLFRDGDEFWPVLELRNEKFIPLHERALPLEYAQGIVEGFLALIESKVIDKEADWRQAPMSPRQKYVLDKYRIKYDDTWTRGMAADALGQKFAAKRVKVLQKNFNAQKWRSALAEPHGRAWLEQRLMALRVHAQARARVAQTS
ncbi:Helicase conserved C-terminal domain-containing protein [Alicyclobacillus hesperidum]|uniref:Helicase conserved C-terminal domain-containing protein n=1 Tax=Alicyclobacillus hesperidum TaxID=89784 RepID=A0A1H2YAT5_9BACL|nr:DEAD/DEAH box helicase [Alicyclobacillus hesperidum]SDX02161.1 Helicase conserved C-terminal domain-containing protein [Alicyclobacillus hesperidum]